MYNNQTERNGKEAEEKSLLGDKEILERQTSGGDGNLISRVDSRGNITKVVDPEEVTSSVLPSFFGNSSSPRVGSKKSWNPFRKSSGLMGVMHMQTKKNRLISKHGRINVFTRKEEVQESHRYLKDFFTSMIELSWSWTLFSFAASFCVSWLLFAVVWFLIIYQHGDLDSQLPEDHVLCVDNLQDFTSCYLFSLELQHTIGFGGRATTGECPQAIIVMTIQAIIGVVIQACMAGIVFAKFTKPTSRGETIMFSKNALISMRNGALYLLVRVGDLRPTHLIECHVSAHFLSKEMTEEGEVIPYHLASMQFGSSLDGESAYIQPFWPLVVSHKIDNQSPLYSMSPKDFQTRQFEIIVTVEGTSPETGNSVQSRTSYLPSEVLWGHRFEHTGVAYDTQVSKYAVSYSTLNNFVPDRTPRVSGQELASRRRRKSVISNNSLQIPVVNDV